MQMRSMLRQLKSSSDERVWIRNQSTGDLDDTKLVDGVAGERLVFKRRQASNKTGAPKKQMPKRFLFVMDVSGSMYRFNGQDKRLERMLETSMMIMESFIDFEENCEYSIIGHSGDSHRIPFVDFGEPPSNRMDRLKVYFKLKLDVLN